MNLDFWGEMEESLSSLIDELFVDDFYSKIINSDAFNRLENISFLGAIDYAWNSKLKKAEKSRYTHSLNVAALAKYVSYKRQYSKEIERLVVSAALLHDIGHAPLSHSAESAIKDVHGVGHHELGNQIIEGRVPIGKALSAILNKYVDTQQLLQLLDHSCKEDFADIFYNPINIDTIDGILRTHNFFHQNLDYVSSISVAKAAFLENSEESKKYLDSFWCLKDLAYNYFISSEKGLLADYLSQSYFSEHSNAISFESLMESEQSWKKRHTKLFSDLESVGSDHSDYSNREIHYIKREYIINNEDARHLKRYECKKVKETFVVRYQENQNFEQVLLMY